MEKFNVCLGTSFRISQKSLVYRQKMLFFFFSFMCHVCVLTLPCLFIVSGKFDALHQLSVKNDPLEIQHPKLENNRCSFIESIHER